MSAVAIANKALALWGLSVVLALTCSANSTSAQSVGQFLELPSHRALMAVREGRAPAPFVTDGCSGGLSAGWAFVANRFPGFAAANGARPPWETCCIVHDRDYHDAAGTSTAEASWHARLAADRALRSCVEREAAEAPGTSGQPAASAQGLPDWAARAVAGAMYRAVRLGGAPCTGLSWRWGFGYPPCNWFRGPDPARD